MEKKIEAYGVKGMKSTPWRKTFKSQAAFEKWIDKNEGNIEIYGTREKDRGHLRRERRRMVMYKVFYESDNGLKMVLCSDMQWRHAGFNDGAHFTEKEVEYLIDRWNKNGVVDTRKIKKEAS